MKTGLKQQSNAILMFTAYYNYSCFCPRQKFNLNFFSNLSRNFARRMTSQFLCFIFLKGYLITFSQGSLFKKKKKRRKYMYPLKIYNVFKFEFLPFLSEKFPMMPYP